MLNSEVNYDRLHHASVNLRSGDASKEDVQYISEYVNWVTGLLSGASIESDSGKASFAMRYLKVNPDSVEARKVVCDFIDNVVWQAAQDEYRPKGSPLSGNEDPNWLDKYTDKELGILSKEEMDALQLRRMEEFVFGKGEYEYDGEDAEYEDEEEEDDDEGGEY